MKVISSVESQTLSHRTFSLRTVRRDMQGLFGVVIPHLPLFPNDLDLRTIAGSTDGIRGTVAKRETIVHFDNVGSVHGAAQWAAFQAYRERGGAPLRSLVTQVPSLEPFSAWTRNQTRERNSPESLLRDRLAVQRFFVDTIDGVPEGMLDLLRDNTYGHLSDSSYEDTMANTQTYEERVANAEVPMYTKFVANGKDVPTTARTLAEGYAELIRPGQDADRIVAQALGASSLGELTDVWSGAMRARNAYDAADYVLRSLS